MVMETRRANVREALPIPNRTGGQPPQIGGQLPDAKLTVEKELDDLLGNAITEKHLLRFTYKGRERIVEPHDYGIQNGIVRLFGHQVGGGGSSRLPGWRLVDVSEMQDCEMLKRRFAGNREVPSGKHHRWDAVFIRVAPPAKP
jgi:hypothetical protein